MYDGDMAMAPNISDEQLVRHSAVGDARAFVELVRRNERVLTALVRYEVRDPASIEDVLQETLLQAWRGVGTLRQPAHFRAWLLQIARNRCRDFHRRSTRQGPVIEIEPHLQAAMSGDHPSEAAEFVEEILESLESRHPENRKLIEMFYLEGLSIDQIARRIRRPQGTVKRQLFAARNMVRSMAGIDRQERRIVMGSKKDRKPDFPERRPQITIEPSRARPFAVSVRELLWWPIIPDVGAQASGGWYDPPDWTLASVTSTRSVRPAQVHHVDCVEVEVNEWTRKGGWSEAVDTVFARLTDEKSQWLGVSRIADGMRKVFTFLGDDFEGDGGQHPRRIEDRGRFIEESFGVFRQSGYEPDAIGCGMFRLKVGPRAFTCLRTFYLDGELSGDHTTLIEAYFTRQGRTILQRHYCQRRCSESQRFRLDDQTRRTIDGVTFVHWYEVLFDTAIR